MGNVLVACPLLLLIFLCLYTPPSPPPLTHKYPSLFLSANCLNAFKMSIVEKVPNEANPESKLGEESSATLTRELTGLPASPDLLNLNLY